MRNYIRIHHVGVDVSSCFGEEEAKTIRKITNAFLNFPSSHRFQESREIEDALEIALFNCTGLVVRVDATTENTYYDEELQLLCITKRDFTDYVYKANR